MFCYIINNIKKQNHNKSLFKTKLFDTLCHLQAIIQYNNPYYIIYNNPYYIIAEASVCLSATFCVFHNLTLDYLSLNFFLVLETSY